MKKILMAVCLAGLSFACKSTADVSASAPEPCKPDCAMECCADKAAECTDEMKAECQKKCEGEQVCPVTGKSMN